MKWTRLSCTTFRANAVRLQLHALAYNLANFLRMLVLPTAIADWSAAGDASFFTDSSLPRRYPRCCTARSSGAFRGSQRRC